MPGTFIDLEFDTTVNTGAPLGDIASSLVSIHDLLRDLGAMAAYPSSVEYRDIRVVGIEMRNPLKIRVSLLAIPPEAVKAFQDICRSIIQFRQQRSTKTAMSGAVIRNALDLVLRSDGRDGHLTEQEEQRFYGLVAALQNAEVPLKRVMVTED